jgi:hypothetical protein
MKERQLMTEGKTYGDAYEDAVQIIQNQRESKERLVKSHFKIAIPDSLERDAGVIDPDKLINTFY